MGTFSKIRTRMGADGLSTSGAQEKPIRGNLGSVGIVQDASDEVHQQRVDGTALEVLPCVTLHPGIEPPFPASGAREPTQPRDG